MLTADGPSYEVLSTAHRFGFLGKKRKGQL